MEPSTSSPPAPDEVELSVFGPGYGEAIALHIGDGKWVLIDSCIDPQSGLPAALDYLIRLGVNVAHDVQLIVATHWHDDHIRGLYGLVNACELAKLCISSVVRSNEFTKLVALYVRDSASGIKEFTDIFENVTPARRTSIFGSIKLASADKLLLRDTIRSTANPLPVNIYALSPSDVALLINQMALANQLPLAGSARRRLAPPSPNHASVALWIELGDTRLLLGADLENTGQREAGWEAVLLDSNVTEGQADAFKVPHHGSETGHHDGVWTQLLTHSPVSVITPFRQGRHLLPKSNDIERIRSLSPYVFLTAAPKTKQPRWRRRVVRDFVEQVTRELQPAISGWGHVRLRRRYSAQAQEWQASLFGDAYQVP